MSPESRIFGEIALSLSGGGYRAAAYHLGVLDMLERLGLLKDVRSLSTVSGGTIVGMFYAVSVTESTSFDDFYGNFYAFLRGKNIISQAFEHLSQEATRAGQPSLIKSAAEVYASEDFLGNRRFGHLLDSPPTHLTEQVFNTTDFRNGVSFRFLKSESDQALIGNTYASMPRDIAKKVRLADIVAASSCFPSVFEPLAFPDDFSWDDLSPIDEVRSKLGRRFEKPIALMDGGIFDNQGVDSIKQIYRRKGREIGLFIISDVDNRADEFYEIKAPRKKGIVSLRKLVLLSWLLFFVGLLSLILLALFAFAAYSTGELPSPVIGLLFGVPGLFTGCALGGMIWIRREFLEISRLAKETAGVNLWHFLRSLSIPELIDLGRSRVSSLITLSSSIFMKRIRDLTFYGLFTHPKYQERLVPTLIYDLLDPESFPEREESEPPDPEAGEVRGKSPNRCSEQLSATVLAAKDYETNLWFVDEEKLKSLVGCGQATMCLKIIRYLEKHRAEAIEDLQSNEAKLYAAATGLWHRLDENSFSLLDRTVPTA